jgi:hypothetical protein
MDAPPRAGRREPAIRSGRPCASLPLDTLNRHQERLPGEHAGHQMLDKTQRLLNRAVWDTFAVMRVVRQFSAAAPATQNGYFQL